jgi:predicted LPLAT superfamily acyltransferase
MTTAGSSSRGPQSPQGRRGADWTQAPERSHPWALSLMCGIALAAGRRVSRLLLYPITAYFVLFSPAARRQSRRYLDRALGRPAGWRDGFRQVFAFASTILDRVYLLRDRHDLFDIRSSGTDVLEATLAEGRGAFLVGAHVGSFETLRSIGRSRPDTRVAMVMYPDNAQMINRTLAAIAPQARPEIIALGRVDSMLAIRDWLDAGGLAGMLGDRSLPPAANGSPDAPRSNTIAVPFLGREALFNDGPFRLAALLRRRVIFMAAPYLGGARYEVRFETLADFSQRSVDGAERERRIEAALRAYVARLELLCREHPYNWFNFHDFWGEDVSDR